ncbi:DUF1656 domain-containing protein [Pseudomonas matsuisoli]|nr:DUF1656 domain-containing protein [Pseudomonas matsuisoli]
MMGDVDIAGVYLPMLLVLMIATYVLYLPLNRLLIHLHFYRLVWHRALFNVALYAVLLCAVDFLCRSLMQ